MQIVVKLLRYLLSWILRDFKVSEANERWRNWLNLELHSIVTNLYPTIEGRSLKIVPKCAPLMHIELGMCSPVEVC